LSQASLLKNFRPRWGIFEVLTVLVITLLAPMAVTFYVYLLTELGILPPLIRQVLSSNHLLLTSLRVIFSLALEFSLLLWVMRRYDLSWRDFGWRKFKIFRSVIYIVACYWLLVALVLIVSFLVSWLFPSIDLNEPQKNILEFNNQGIGWYLNLLMILFITPVVEETYFRGFIFPAFSKTFGYLLGAIISSMLFGLLHFQANVIIYTFLLGLLLSFMYYRLGSIIPTIILHGLNNLIAYLIMNKII